MRCARTAARSMREAWTTAPPSPSSRSTPVIARAVLLSSPRLGTRSIQAEGNKPGETLQEASRATRKGRPLVPSSDASQREEVKIKAGVAREGVGAMPGASGARSGLGDIRGAYRGADEHRRRRAPIVFGLFSACRPRARR